MAYTTKILVGGSALVEGDAKVKDTIVYGNLAWRTYQKDNPDGKKNACPFVLYAKDAAAATAAAETMKNGRRLAIWQGEYKCPSVQGKDGYSTARPVIVLRDYDIVQRVGKTGGYDALRFAGDLTLTKDAEVRGNAGTIVAGRAAWNTYKKDAENGEGNFADFSIFASSAAAAEKMVVSLVKGVTVAVSEGELQDTSYTNRNGIEVPRHSFVIRTYRVIERANKGGHPSILKANFGDASSAPAVDADNFVNVNDIGLDDLDDLDGLPFN